MSFFSRLAFAIKTFFYVLNQAHFRTQSFGADSGSDEKAKNSIRIIVQPSIIGGAAA